MKRRKGKPTAIGSVVGQVLGDLGLDAAVSVVRIGEMWEEVVGPEIARHCRPVALRGRVLEAEVDSSVWCQQLQMERPRLLRALRGALGDEAPTDLHLRVGYARRR